MSHGVSSLLLVAILASAAGPAKADWRFTHWGMTPEQVVAASSGTVQLLPSGERTRNDDDHWEISAKGRVSDGGSTTDVGFMFDTKGRGLTCVLYNARGGEAEKLGAKLTSELGKPKKDENDGPMRDMIWAAP